MMGADNKYFTVATVLLLFTVTIAIYYPGLSSSFLLDDVNNLGGLALIPEQGILNYIFSGFAGPAGRPLSLFSFALQHSAWPDNPFAFKAVNLLIHLLCGALIFLICNRIARYLKFGPGECRLFSLFVTSVWLLHPIQLTTVLYVVQRMTQLSTLFVLLGVYAYLAMRERYLQRQQMQSLIVTGFAVWVCMALAVLGKENGVLLPLFLLVIHMTLLSAEPLTPALKKWHWLVLGLPLFTVAVYLVVTFSSAQSSYGFRPYNMSERLMTESVIMLDYVRNILLPYPGAFSLYRDDFPISRGLLQPPITLLSLIVITLLLVGAVILRKRYPLPSFAILWFFAGHFLESTHINLELYFEHRNYLPALGIIVLIAYLLVLLIRTAGLRWYGYAGILAFAALVLVNTLMQINLWVNPLQRHIEMVNRQPDSVRAKIGLGNQYIINNRIAEAESLYRQIAKDNPHEIYPYLKLAAIKGCVTGQGLDPAEWQVLTQSAANAKKPVFGITEEMTILIAAVIENDCAEMDPHNLIRVVVTLAMNPEFGGDRAVLHELAARLGIFTGDANVAYHNIVDAVKISPTVSRQMLKIRILLALGKLDEAGNSLQGLANAINNSYRLRLVYADILNSLQTELNAAITSSRSQPDGN